jgi:hypothetical protein
VLDALLSGLKASHITQTSLFKKNFSTTVKLYNFGHQNPGYEFGSILPKNARSGSAFKPCGCEHSNKQVQIRKQTHEKAFPSKLVLENCSEPYDYVYPYPSKAGLQGMVC